MRSRSHPCVLWSIGLRGNRPIGPGGAASPGVDTADQALDAAVVVLPLALLPGILLAELTVPPGPFPHDAAVSTVAQVFAYVLVTSARCPDLFANTNVDQLQTALGLSGKDSPEILALQQKIMVRMTDDIDRVGTATWCDGAYARLGPDGTLMKGLLRRCDPRSNGC